MYNFKRLEEIATNEAFIKWIKEGPSLSEWESFKLRHSLSEEELEFAKLFVDQAGKAPATPEHIQEEVWEKIALATKPRRRFTKVYLLFVIAILTVFTCSIIYFTQPASQQNTDIAMKSSDQWIEYTNTTDSNWPIDLSDGSQVILEPQASLKYPRLFSQKSRKVQLSGDAFFDISHDTLKPFYVYANEAVVRVLGTSFYVKAEEEDKDIQVIVKTGKVAVYKGKEIVEYQAKKIKKLEPLLVAPNQIATLSKSSLDLGKRLVSRPTLTQPLKAIKKIHFQNSPISEIAEALQNAYGVEIILDETITDDCRLTTTLTDQPLFEKLKIICDPLGINYLEKDVRIYLSGNCKN